MLDFGDGLYACDAAHVGGNFSEVTDQKQMWSNFEDLRILVLATSCRY